MERYIDELKDLLVKADNDPFLGIKAFSDFLQKAKEIVQDYQSHILTGN